MLVGRVHESDEPAVVDLGVVVLAEQRRVVR
ncbi:hypothetical protein N798_09295 [Knoellia flava TL1]|uniref:Uncharacterized protein n=1 Tax=Knoellia flava TL1 TaxID=1385518 RepID=A0ABR4XE78_9MICO|nr:hypothetical protein N798_09295 [Knoellia flava TL1]